MFWRIDVSDLECEVRNHNLCTFDTHLGKFVDGLFQLAHSDRSAVAQVRHTSKGMAVPEVFNMPPRL